MGADSLPDVELIASLAERLGRLDIAAVLRKEFSSCSLISQSTSMVESGIPASTLTLGISRNLSAKRKELLRLQRAQRRK